MCGEVVVIIIMLEVLNELWELFIYLFNNYFCYKNIIYLVLYLLEG